MPKTLKLSLWFLNQFKSIQKLIVELGNYSTHPNIFKNILFARSKKKIIGTKGFIDLKICQKYLNHTCQKLNNLTKAKQKTNRTIIFYKSKFFQKCKVCKNYDCFHITPLCYCYCCYVTVTIAFILLLLSHHFCY